MHFGESILIVGLLWSIILPASAFSFLSKHSSKYGDSESIFQLSQEESYQLDDAFDSASSVTSSCYLGWDHIADGGSESDGLRQVFARLCELQPSSSCFRDMLSMILPSCEFMSVESRAIHAIRLTFCELDIAGIRPPGACTSNLEDSGSRKKCLNSMQASPQLWTSFSGNFRAIATLCLAERRDHEKENLIALHQNLTAIQAFALQHIKIQLSEMDHKSDEWNSAYSVWQESLTQIDQRLTFLDKSLSGIHVDMIQKLNWYSSQLQGSFDQEMLSLVHLKNFTDAMISRIRKDAEVATNISDSALLSATHSIQLSQDYVDALGITINSLVSAVQTEENSIRGSLGQISNDFGAIAQSTAEIMKYNQKIESSLSLELDQRSRIFQEQTLMLDQIQETSELVSRAKQAITNLEVSAEASIGRLSEKAQDGVNRIEESVEHVELRITELDNSIQQVSNTFLGLFQTPKAIFMVLCSIICLKSFNIRQCLGEQVCFTF
ncbi:Tht1-like nuclear fusion protein-domain-containing protein [Lipomyces oligophaga]|uniref:Tht1-like nuclear fusion protein-domain-containing protein n=1 Tax=Lipomyces oligophaga TaxID=45792 RepID=UPI0034CDE00B